MWLDIINNSELVTDAELEREKEKLYNEMYF